MIDLSNCLTFVTENGAYAGSLHESTFAYNSFATNYWISAIERGKCVGEK